jgi:hypothetical protein
MSAPQTLRAATNLKGSGQRRAAMRYRLHAPVAFCWVDTKGLTWHGKGHTHDVSTRGICVLCSVSPPLGASVAMNIDIPLPRGATRSLRVEVEGHVVRLESSGMRSSFCVECDHLICPD